MNWLDFIASIVQSLTSLGWPAAVFGSVWLFRRNIAPLLPMLRVKRGEWEVSFRLDQAEKELAQLPPPADVASPTAEEIQRFEQIADLSPRAAMLELRATLEEEVRAAALRAGLDSAANTTTVNLLRQLRQEGIIDPHTFVLLEELRAVGNAAAHNTVVSLSPDDVKRYWRLAERAIAQLAQTRSRGGELPRPH